MSFKLEEYSEGKFLPVNKVLDSEEEMLETAKTIAETGKTIFVIYPDGQKLRYPDGLSCKTEKWSRKMADPRYKHAIHNRSILQKKGIEVGSLIDIHEPPFLDRDWIGPYEVSSVVIGGTVAVKTKRGNFSWCRVRIHQEK